MLFSAELRMLFFGVVVYFSVGSEYAFFGGATSAELRMLFCCFFCFSLTIKAIFCII